MIQNQIPLFNFNTTQTDIHSDWVRTSLGDLCKQDRVTVTSQTNINKLPFLMLEHIESNTGKITLPDNSDEYESQSTTFIFNEDHILYAKLRPYLNKVALPNFKGVCTTELIPLLPNPGISRRYLAWLFRRPETVAFAMQGKTGGRMPRANMDELLSLEVTMPNSYEEQERLADIVDQKIHLIEEARAACERQIKFFDKLRGRILTDFSTIEAFSGE